MYGVVVVVVVVVVEDVCRFQACLADEKSARPLTPETAIICTIPAPEPTRKIHANKLKK